MAARKIGMLGDGHVGSALTRGLAKAGHEVKAVGNDKEAMRALADWADVVFLAVPFTALPEVAEAIAPVVSSKTVVDVTNAIDPDRNLALGFTTSGGEELQRKLPRAHVVKAFNTVFAAFMDSGQLSGQTLTVFVAGDDAAARSGVLELARGIGFDAVDAGPLRNARFLEPMGYLNIQLAMVQGLGGKIGLKLVRGP